MCSQTCSVACKPLVTTISAVRGNCQQLLRPMRRLEDTSAARTGAPRSSPNAAMRDAVLDDFDASHLSPVAAALFSRAREYFADIIKPGGFVHRMHTGALDRNVYAQYLAIDRYFLFHFNRAYAVALMKARTVDEQAVFHALIGGVLDEMRLHVGACARWGVDADYYSTHPPEPAAKRYVEFLESLHAGSMVGLIAGMVPCMRLYSALGAGFSKIGLEACGPYKEWFDAYGSKEMNALASQLESLLPTDVDDLTPEIIVNYCRAMELERDFFEAWVV